MAALIQGADGEWRLTVSHSIPDARVRIPASFTWSGITVYFTGSTCITNIPQTKATGWITPIESGNPFTIKPMVNGVSEPDDIERTYGTYKSGNTVYAVINEEFNVVPFDSGATQG